MGHFGQEGLNKSMMTPEQQAVLRSVRKLVDFWQIQAEELRMDVNPATREVLAPVVLPPKYKHPRTGETWDGQGTQPQWLREALTKQGYTVDELRPDSALNQPPDGPMAG